MIKNKNILSTNNKLNMKGNLKWGLEPWIDDNSKVLVLGTLPGDESLKVGRYYADSNNSFWEIMNELFPLKPGESNNKEYILSHGIALWDCLRAGEREGSCDSRFGEIKIPNDLKTLLADYPNVRYVVLNGRRTTANMYFEYFSEIKDVKVQRCDSTSGSLEKELEEKVMSWGVIKRFLEGSKSK